MRISDWSSDVCSSDLAWTRAAPGSSRTNARSAEASRIALLTRGFRAPLRDQLLRPQGLVVLGIAPDRVLHAARSEESRVGNECVSTCRSRWSPYPYKQKPQQNLNRTQTVPQTD